MNLEELVLKSLGKRPLLREKIKEERKNKIYSSIENIENLISKKNELATKIMKSTLLNLDCSKAVSYTHLDVYKRQGYDCFTCK